MKQVGSLVLSLVILTLVMVFVGCQKRPYVKINKEVIAYAPPFGIVTFTHKKHSKTLKIACQKCHHTWKKGESSGKMCKDCHKAKIEGNALATKDAFHRRCKGCHDDLKKASKPAGPTGCIKCHVKADSLRDELSPAKVAGALEQSGFSYHKIRDGQLVLKEIVFRKPPSQFFCELQRL